MIREGPGPDPIFTKGGMPVSPEIYEVVSQGARYWFLFLMGVIVWRSYRWLARDRKQRKKRLRLLPDAGFIGELVVQTGQESLLPGTVLPVPREGTLGSSRGCDLCVSLPGVARTHLWFRYEDGVGLRVRPLGSNKIQVDGLACEHRRQGLLMLHGSRLVLGEGVLRLRMFAGFETTAHAAPLEAPDFEDETEEAAPQAAPPQPVAAMTPDQLAFWQVQQQQYWAMAAQAMAAQAAAQAVQAVSSGRPYGAYANQGFEDDALEDEALEGQSPDDAPLEEESLEDRSFEDEDATKEIVRYLEENSRERFHGERDQDRAQQPDPRQVFYPPVLEEEEEPRQDPWPYAPYPQSDVVFENQGYTYPELVEADPLDEDLTDAAAPPKSLYVEPDEAERAKKLLWDRYLGGRKKP